MDPPPAGSFNQEELDTLNRIAPEDPMRLRFASVIYYLDKMVSQVRLCMNLALAGF